MEKLGNYNLTMAQKFHRLNLNIEAIWSLKKSVKFWSSDLTEAQEKSIKKIWFKWMNTQLDLLDKISTDPEGASAAEELKNELLNGIIE